MADLYDKVNTHYSSIAREDGKDNAEHIKKVALAFGYDPEDLAAIPDGANLGVSCGNPLTVASLKEGETVIDLGCGAGFDIFQAARKVGPTGHAIGIDMSEDMLARARLNATKSSITNAQFVKSAITAIPLDAETANCIISNCVINLVPHEDKHLVFEEMFRLLKRGGRVSISDILAKKEMGAEMQRDLGLYVGCISGASLVGQYEGWLRGAGFKDILIVDKKSDLNIYKERGQSSESGSKDSGCCAPAPSSCCSTKASAEEQAEKGAADWDFNEWVGSFSIYAIKPDL